jgi:hypothetical protein
LEHETTFEHDVVEGALRQAPVPGAQAPVAPHGGETTQLAAQQTPLMPQTLLAHWSLAEQAPPLASLFSQCWVEVLQ